MPVTSAFIPFTLTRNEWEEEMERYHDVLLPHWADPRERKRMYRSYLHMQFLRLLAHARGAHS